MINEITIEEMRTVLEEDLRKVSKIYPDLDIDSFLLCIYKCAKATVLNVNGGITEFTVALDNVNMTVSLKDSIETFISANSLGLQFECKIKDNTAYIKVVE